MATKRKRKSRRTRWVVGLLLLLLVAGAVLMFLSRRVRGAQMAYEKGKLYLESGDAPSALASFRRALEARPGYREAQRGIARAYVDLCSIMIPFISLLTYRIAYINVKQPRALSPVYENRVEWVDSRALMS